VRKVFRPVGIIFKGSGFYTTDYRKPDEKKPPKEEKAAAGTGTKKTSD
jgi:predicted nucleic acid-binding Zn ribbon protein